MVISTILFIALNPERYSLYLIQKGDCLISISLIIPAQYLLHLSGSFISTLAKELASLSISSYSISGILTGTSVIAETSLAIPRMDVQSPLFGVISISKTQSSTGMASFIDIPIVVPEGSSITPV